MPQNLIAMTNWIRQKRGQLNTGNTRRVGSVNELLNHKLSLILSHAEIWAPALVLPTAVSPKTPATLREHSGLQKQREKIKRVYRSTYAKGAINPPGSSNRCAKSPFRERRITAIALGEIGSAVQARPLPGRQTRFSLALPVPHFQQPQCQGSYPGAKRRRELFSLLEFIRHQEQLFLANLALARHSFLISLSPSPSVSQS